MPDSTLRALVDDLASPDPAVRDDRAYAALAGLLRDGGLDEDDRSWLGAVMVDRLGHGRIEARSFAPLVLAGLVAAGDQKQEWVPAVSRWYVAETDLRGHDPDLGWLHAVAHGADFFGECGVAGLGDAADLLDALARRLVAATTAVWRDQEDDRVARALALVLSRAELEPAVAVAWLRPVRAMFASGAPGPVPAEAGNTMRTLRSLHVALGEQLLHRGEPVRITVALAEQVRGELSDVLAEVTPWFWRPRAR